MQRTVQRTPEVEIKEQLLLPVIGSAQGPPAIGIRVLLSCYLSVSMNKEVNQVGVEKVPHC